MQKIYWLILFSSHFKSLTRDLFLRALFKCCIIINHLLLCIAFSKVTKLVISELVITSPINFKFVCSTNSFNALKNESLLKGASINYVSKILPIFDPLTLRNQVYYISLCSSIYIWSTPLLVYVVYEWPQTHYYSTSRRHLMPFKLFELWTFTCGAV